ncbi:unnamed protein product [Cunninghamella echinulata]
MSQIKSRPNTICSSISSKSSTSQSIKFVWKQLSALFQHKRASISSLTSTFSSTSSVSSSSVAEKTITSPLPPSSLNNKYQTENKIDHQLNTIKSPSISRKYNNQKRMNSHRHKNKAIERENDIPHVTVPPFSPTYCKPNEFPYSNFYIKLPNGNFLIRYRDGNRNILGSDEIQGYLI